MFSLVGYLILVIFVIDIIFTYVNIRKYRKLYPEKDYTKLELNPIPKFFWKKINLLWGGIIATIVQAGILVFVLFMFGKEFSLVFLGAYLVILLIHIDNHNLMRERKKKEQKWRKYAIFIILLLGVIDMGLTYYYVDTYSKWQPDRLFEDMETNPLLIFLWNNFGLPLGMLAGMFIILPLQYVLAKKAWIGVVILFGAVLIFVLYNHYNNITLLHEYIAGVIN